MGKTMIAMSGGVDSSVAAGLMKKQGEECIGVTMCLTERISSEGRTTAETPKDVKDARAVAEQLNIPFFVVDFAESFRQEIIEPFVKEYMEGRTPNPCVHCNRTIKFGRLMEKAKEMDCDRLATGHYARIRHDGERYQLMKASDTTKDQSYMLYQLTQEQLAHISFPLGEFRKDEVRQIAEDWGLNISRKKDSQDICFVPDGDYSRVVQEVCEKDSAPGEFVDAEGNVLGTHRGIIHYTIGQRRGLGIAAPEPLYVLRIDPEKNRVVLGSHEMLFSRSLEAGQFHWISGQPPKEAIRARAKIRYHHKEALCTVRSGPAETAHIEFDEPQRAITPGQAVVIYDGDMVLGGGTIV